MTVAGIGLVNTICNKSQKIWRSLRAERVDEAKAFAETDIAESDDRGRNLVVGHCIFENRPQTETD
jgi:hypothetical protein